MFRVDRAKAIDAISTVIANKDDDILRKMFYHFESDHTLPQAEIFKLWHNLAPIESLTDRELKELLEFCVKNCGIGEMSEFMMEVDTEPIKVKYIESIANAKTRYTVSQFLRLFTDFIEAHYEKPLCHLTRDEALDGMANLPDASVNSLRQALTVARVYCEWCMKQEEFGEEAGNPFAQIKTDNIALEPWVENHLVRDEFDLKQKLEIALPFNMGYVAPPAAVFAWLGFSLDEARSILESAVDLYQRTVHGVPVPDVLMPILVEYHNATRLDDSKPSKKEPTFLRRVSKRLGGDPYPKTEISRVLSVVEGLRYTTIRLSAQMHELYQREQRQGKLTNNDYAQCCEVNLSVSSAASQLKDKRRLYAAYKNVFNL